MAIKKDKSMIASEEREFAGFSHKTLKFLHLGFSMREEQIVSSE